MLRKHVAIDYKVVQEVNLESLRREVNSYLADDIGWDVAGAVVITETNKSIYYHQTMVRYADIQS